MVTNPKSQGLQTTKVYFSFALHVYCRGALLMETLRHLRWGCTFISDIDSHYDQGKDRALEGLPKQFRALAWK